MSESTKAVFLSYASQDAIAAKKICDALRAAGIEVWFDQNELVGGDAWDAKIRGQIASCTLFMPVISANTQARLEGYFRLEWKIAAQRTHTMAEEKAFLLPLVIDDTRDAEARVPAEFRAVQWTRLPAGDTHPAFCTRVKQLLDADGLLAATPVTPTGSTAPTKPVRTKTNWMGYGWAAVGIVFALVYAVRPFWSERGATKEKDAARASAEAARPLDRALQLRALNGLTRERLGAADELLAQALKADPTNADVLAVAAQVDALMVYRSWDLSDERRQSAAKRSARAVALATDAFEARRAQAMVAAFTVRSPESLREAEETYRGLATERVDDDNVTEELGTIVAAQRRYDEAAKLFTQAHRPQQAGNAYYAAGQIEQARRIADELLAQRRSAAALILKANVELFGYNDLAAAQNAVSQLTPSELREDDAAGVALRLAVLRRDAPGILRLLEPFPHPFVSILGVNYPRQYWTGLARSLLNQPEAAQIEWRGGMRSIEERLQARPSDYDALSWAAMFHAALDQRAETDQALRTYANYTDLTTGRWDFNYCVPLLRLGLRHDEVIARLAKSLRDTARFNRILYAWARYSPEFDPVRGNPAFERLLRETRPALARPFEDEAPAAIAPAAPDEKSVAVLAFANLSDDKANEYFSDGISEELLNVLAKVPGLKVSARTSAFYFKGKDIPIPDIAQKLGVAYVVEGSVRKAGDKVRITAQLIKAADGFHVWSDTFTRDLKDVFAVQDEIAGLIARNLQLRLGEASGAKTTATAAVGADELEAYRLYWEAREAWNRRNAAGFDRAETLLERAIQLAPRFAKAHSALADVWELRGEWENALGPFANRNSELAQRIRRKVEEALELDPLCAEAHASRGLIAWNSWQFEAAERSLREAIRLNPNYASAHQWLARAYMIQGRLDEALTSFARAAELDPLSPRILDNYAWGLLHAGRRTEALAFLDRALALQPDAVQPISMKARILAEDGKKDEAAALERSVPRGVWISSHFRALTLGFIGDAEAKSRLEALVPDRNYMTSFTARLALGRTDEALDQLVPERFESTRVDLLLFDPFYDRVRRDPRFVRALDAIGLSAAHARAQAWRAAHSSAVP